MPELREYLDTDGRSVFGRWFADLDAAAAARVATALTRLERGNFSNVEPVGEGMTEYKIDFGPGYRIVAGSATRPSCAHGVSGPQLAQGKHAVKREH
jgi:putative component of toxin-antitoxin plasmid stabilization module